MKYLVKCAWTVAGKKKETAEEFDTYGGAKGFAENVLFLLDGTDVTVKIYELKESHELTSRTQKKTFHRGLDGL